MNKNFITAGICIIIIIIIINISLFLGGEAVKFLDNQISCVRQLLVIIKTEIC